MADISTFAEPDDDREAYITVSPERTEEFRARVSALWADLLRRWAANDG